MRSQSQTRVAFFEIDRRIDLVGKTIRSSPETIHHARNLLLEAIDFFPYIYYLEFSLALLYYSSRTHEPIPLRVIVDIWEDRRRLKLSRSKLNKGERKALERIYRHAKYRTVAKYYRKLVPILGKPLPFDPVEWIVSFINELSDDSIFCKSKEVAKELARTFPPGKYNRDLVLWAGAYLYLAANIERRKVSIRHTEDYLGRLVRNSRAIGRISVPLRKIRREINKNSNLITETHVFLDIKEA